MANIENTQRSLVLTIATLLLGLIAIEAHGLGVVNHGGLHVEPLGQASLSPGPLGSLVVSNIGSSGDDGVSFDLGQIAGGFGAVVNLGPAGDLMPGIRYKLDFLTPSGEPAFALQLSETMGGLAEVNFDTSLLMPGQVRVEAWVADKPVDFRTFEAPYPAFFVQGEIGSYPDIGQHLAISNIGSSGQDGPEGFTVDSFFDLNWGGGVVQIAGGKPVDADRIVIHLLETKPVDFLNFATMRAIAPIGASYQFSIHNVALGNYGNAHVSQGMAHMRADDHLVISNIGSSGQDGVLMDFGLGLLPNEFIAGFGMDFMIQGKPVDSAFVDIFAIGNCHGANEQTCAIGFSRITNEFSDAMHVELSTSFAPMGSPTHTVQLFLMGELVAEVMEISEPLIINKNDLDISVMNSVAVHAEGHFNWMMNSVQNIQIPGGPTIPADEIMLIAEKPINPGGSAIDQLESVTVLCNLIAPLLILDEITVEVAPPCPWDLDGNGTVSTGDLLALFSQWGTDGPADFDESGAVGTGDLLILFANWGPCK